MSVLASGQKKLFAICGRRLVKSLHVWLSEQYTDFSSGIKKIHSKKRPSSGKQIQLTLLTSEAMRESSENLSTQGIRATLIHTNSRIMLNGSTIHMLFTFRGCKITLFFHHPKDT